MVNGQCSMIKLCVRLISALSLAKGKGDKYKAMVKESMTRAFDELHSGDVRHDARNMFKK